MNTEKEYIKKRKTGSAEVFYKYGSLRGYDVQINLRWITEISAQREYYRT